MQHPVVGDNFVKKLCRGTVTFCESWSIKFLARPILFILPPTLVTLAATKTNIKDQVVDIFGQDVGSFINSSALLVVIGTFLYVVFMRALYAGISAYSKPARNIEVNELLAILKAINLVVGDKCKRMSDEAKKILSKTTVCPATTFTNITRPDQQIPLLIAGIKSVFEYMDQANTIFRIGLLRIIDNKPTEWIAFEPASNPPRTPAQNLSVPSSTVMHSIKNKSIITIQDIQSELSKRNKDKRRFVKSNTQPNDQGSQLCYPIVHPATGNVEYVITIAGNKKDCLIEKHTELYAWVIEHFSLRISLEHSLLVMKEKSNEL
ncbi:MAG TPA: hypothetical protein ENJ28_00120 [Gammaproteobacteria bacterium]|nr:hypothetical protein [Gammaproteobacteria bacterium]